jgi:hypothetical protein
VSSTNRDALFGVDSRTFRPEAPRDAAIYALEIAAGDFAFAAGHRRSAVNLLASAPNSAAPFSIAVASSTASTARSHTALLAIL